MNAAPATYVNAARFYTDLRKGLNLPVSLCHLDDCDDDAGGEQGNFQQRGDA